MCGGHGVCRVREITSNPMDKSDWKTKYYILEPVFEKGSTIYTPVDNDKMVMRKVMSEDDAKELVNLFATVQTVKIREEKNREQLYKEAIRTYDSQSLVQIIKTLYLRRQDRVRQGKKVLSSDEHYLKKAEELLFNEMSVALSIPRENIETYLEQELHSSQAE